MTARHQDRAVVDHPHEVGVLSRVRTGGEGGPPLTAGERCDYLERRAMEALGRGSVVPTEEFTAHLRDRMAQAAQAWDCEVADLRGMLADAHEELATLRARRAMLEEALASAGAEATELRVQLDDLRQGADAAAQRHALDNGRRRRLIAGLAEELAQEMRRGGGVP